MLGAASGSALASCSHCCLPSLAPGDSAAWRFSIRSSLMRICASVGSLLSSRGLGTLLYVYLSSMAALYVRGIELGHITATFKIAKAMHNILHALHPEPFKASPQSTEVVPQAQSVDRSALQQDSGAQTLTSPDARAERLRRLCSRPPGMLQKKVRQIWDSCTSIASLPLA